jgi:hypothetical protein
VKNAQMSRPIDTRQVVFDPTPEIFASSADGGFSFPLVEGGKEWVETVGFDESRFVLSMWHPSSTRTIDLDRAYVELQGRFDTQEEHWVKIAEIEPIVPAYNSGASFDGWIVLPVFAPRSSFRIIGAGLEARARLQIRASAYFVA